MTLPPPLTLREIAELLDTAAREGSPECDALKHLFPRQVCAFGEAQRQCVRGLKLTRETLAVVLGEHDDFMDNLLVECRALVEDLHLHLAMAEMLVETGDAAGHRPTDAALALLRACVETGRQVLETWARAVEALTRLGLLPAA